MVTALIGFNTIGLIGIFLSAPVLATLKLVFDYTIHKLFDLDPWTDLERTPPPVPLSQIVWQNMQNTATVFRTAADQFHLLVQRVRKAVVRR
jgi:hypothetical protein